MEQHSWYSTTSLQEEILNLLPDEEEKQNIGQRLLPPADLIELCLKSENNDLSLLAFDVFAWTSSSFLKSNTSLLEDCWRIAANQDQWDQIYQSSIAEGWSDEETLGILRDTALFQASSRCYGPKAEMFEGGFDEVLPLRQENSELSKESNSTVEAILMQHKNFPDAGKLMLTAVMLGSVQVDDIKMEESPFTMEWKTQFSKIENIGFCAKIFSVGICNLNISMRLYINAKTVIALVPNLQCFSGTLFDIHILALSCSVVLAACRI